MVRGHQLFATKVEPLATKLRDAAIRFEKRLRGAGAEADDCFWVDGIELPEQERRALRDLVFFRKTIFRWAAFHDVADVHVFALQTHRFNHLREKFSGAADEGKALHVFVVAGTFANENKLGFGIAVGENDVGPRFVKLAACAIAEIFANLEERIAFDFAGGFKK